MSFAQAKNGDRILFLLRVYHTITENALIFYTHVNLRIHQRARCSLTEARTHTYTTSNPVTSVSAALTCPSTVLEKGWHVYVSTQRNEIERASSFLFPSLLVMFF